MICHGVGTDTEKANKVAKNIRSIFINSDESEDWENVAKIYRSCTGYTLTAGEAREKFKVDSNSSKKNAIWRLVNVGKICNLKKQFLNVMK